MSNAKILILKFKISSTSPTPFQPPLNQDIKSLLPSGVLLKVYGTVEKPLTVMGKFTSY